MAARRGGTAGKDSRSDWISETDLDGRMAARHDRALPDERSDLVDSVRDLLVRRVAASVPGAVATKSTRTVRRQHESTKTVHFVRSLPLTILTRRAPCRVWQAGSLRTDVPSAPDKSAHACASLLQTPGRLRRRIPRPLLGLPLYKSDRHRRCATL